MVQIVLHPKDVPTGTTLPALFQALGGAVFIAIGQNLFIRKFTTSLESMHNINVEAITRAGATAVKNMAPPEFLQQVLEAYNDSLTSSVFIAGVFITCLSREDQYWRLSMPLTVCYLLKGVLGISMRDHFKC